jgi:hypothetical protein
MAEQHAGSNLAGSSIFFADTAVFFDEKRFGRNDSFNGFQMTVICQSVYVVYQDINMFTGLCSSK